MPRPKKTDRPIEKNISLPTSLVAKVELELFSELEGKVPFGAWQKFLVELIEGHFMRSEGNNDPAVRLVAEFLRERGYTQETSQQMAYKMLKAEGHK